MTPAPQNPWHARAEDLARWAMLRLVNRTDRCGRYSFDAKEERAKPFADPAKAEDAKPGHLTHSRLVRHFRAADTGAVVGSYSYGADKFGKWLCIDIDNHDDTALPLANESYAVSVCRKASGLGLCCLLYESNGNGGFHLWVLFDGAVTAALLRSLGNWLVSDATEFGFTKPPEVFPKSDGGTEWGNWVRLPGRHHTRDVWPRVWDGTEWVSGEDAVAFVLSLAGADPDQIPTAAAAHGIEVQSGGRGNRPDRPQGLVYAWEDFNRKATLESVGAVLERHGWTRARGRSDGAVEYVRPGKGQNGTQGGNLLVADGVPVFFCFTDAAPPLKPMKGYAPAALVATLDHGGDFPASNRALYNRGFGDRVAKKQPATEPRPGVNPEAKPESDPPRKITTLVSASLLYIESLASGAPLLASMSIPELDYALEGGIGFGEMGVLAARPSQGKTAFALQCVHNWTARRVPNSAPCVVISEEMNALMLGKRTMQHISALDQARWAASADRLKGELKLYADGRHDCHVVESCGTAAAAVAAIERHVEEYGCRYAIVDYAQLLRSPGNGRYEQITNTSIALRQLATRTNIVLIVLAQMNRAVEQRGREFLPVMSDLKDTGQLEQDADVLAFMCWPHRLNPAEDRERYQFFVMKNRNRAIRNAVVECRFLPERQTLSDCQPARDDPETGGVL